jgi:urease accessory protein
MKIAGEVRAAGTWDTASAIDRVVLDADERHRRRVMMTGEGGTKFLLDLDRAIQLADGDGLVLADGAVVRIVAKPETLVEISAASPGDRLRIAWHIGNRHTDVEVVGECLRIRRDHVLETMLEGLGAMLVPVEAPFRPEAGAYAGHGHAHRHGR